MRHTALVVGPAAVFAVVVILARWSGNDKSPFLVLAALAVLALLLLVSLVVGALGGPLASRAWALATGAALPLSYTALVVLLAKWRWIDASNWLGFS